MTTVLDVISGGLTYRLTDEDDVAWREGENGLGLPPIRRFVEQGPQQHGATDRGFRLDPRLVQLVFGFQANDPATMYDKRDTLLRIFAPRAQPIYLRYTLPSGQVRQLECHYNGQMTLPSTDRFGYNQRVAVELIAFDPAWYDPTQRSETFGIAVGGDSFTVPMTVPFGVGTSTIDATKTVNYAGTWREYPFIRIIGPITDAKIVNVTTDEKIEFKAGTTIANDDYYDLDLRPGRKTVRNAAGEDRLGDLTDDSDLGTFHLASAIDTPEGANELAVTGTGGTSRTQVLILYYLRYIAF